MKILTKDAFDAMFGGWGPAQLIEAKKESEVTDQLLASPYAGNDPEITAAMLSAGFQAYCEIHQSDEADWSKPALVYRVYVVMERVRQAEADLEMSELRSQIIENADGTFTVPASVIRTINTERRNGPSGSP